MTQAVTHKQFKNNQTYRHVSTTIRKKQFDVPVKTVVQEYFDKYTQLASESMSAGDIIAAEGYYQHAEHYLRMLSDLQSLVDFEKGLSAHSADL